MASMSEPFEALMFNSSVKLTMGTDFDESLSMGDQDLRHEMTGHAAVRCGGIAAAMNASEGGVCRKRTRAVPADDRRHPLLFRMHICVRCACAPAV